jgi:hypothetical protein
MFAHTFKKPCRHVAAHSTKDRMGVFQLHPTITVSLDEVREAYELRKSGMKGDNYAVFGLDGENVERYLPVVERLETSYRITQAKPSLFLDALHAAICTFFSVDNDESPLS